MEPVQFDPVYLEVPMEIVERLGCPYRGWPSLYTIPHPLNITTAVAAERMQCSPEEAYLLLRFSGIDCGFEQERDEHGWPTDTPSGEEWMWYGPDVDRLIADGLDQLRAARVKAIEEWYRDYGSRLKQHLPSRKPLRKKLTRKKPTRTVVYPRGLLALPMTPGIYAIWNTRNGWHYVGKSSSSIRARVQKHYLLLTRPGEERHHCYPLQNAWLRDGSASFAYKVLEEAQDPDLLAEREHYWIAHYEERGCCYNVA